MKSCANQYFFERKFSAFIDEMEGFIRKEEEMTSNCSVTEKRESAGLENIALAYLNIAAAQFGSIARNAEISEVILVLCF